MTEAELLVMLQQVHVVCGLLMAGLCLFVAVVHYPLFAEVARQSEAGFVRYEQLHAKKTTLVVAPLMLLELAGVSGLAVMLGGGFDYLILGMVMGVWGITFLINVPQHGRLAKGWDARVHRSLLVWHSVRTAVWVSKGVIGMMYFRHGGS